MTSAILDTSVYIGHWERGLYAEALEALRGRFIVRHSAVVLSELRRGARTRESQRRVDELRAMAHVCWTPTLDDWWQSGLVVRLVGDAEGWDVAKRREFQNDALIAFSARRHGAIVITASHDDFDRLSRRMHVQVWRV